MHVLLFEDDLDHLVDVKVEALFHPALRLLELLLQVHHLVTINWHQKVHNVITALWMVIGHKSTKG